MRGLRSIFTAIFLGSSLLATAAERINQDGRILGPAPVVTAPILFNTTNADAVVAAMQIFPVTNPWNEDVSQLPVLTNSTAMMAEIITNFNGIHAYLMTLQEMNFVLVPDHQPLVPINFMDVPDESDLNGGATPDGLYPIPADLPLESWPGTGNGSDTNTLYQLQTNSVGDSDAIMVKPGAGYSFETWSTLRVGTHWQAGYGAIFNLNTNGLRPDGWTSADAAGLPLFPAVVRYDEAERGMVEHACRLAVHRYVNGDTYIYPATHTPGGPTGPNYPAMGQRLRLKSTFVIPANWTIEEKAVLLGLKKYGALVADIEDFFAISITPDNRWPANCFNDLTSIGITNFEVVQSTGPDGGPRSPGAPVATAGPDQTVVFGQPAQLAGVVNFSNSPPVIQWTNYSGPGAVTFGNPSQTNTTANFSAPGVYTLELSAADGVHAVAYDAVVIMVTNVITAALARSGTNVSLSWTGGMAPYTVQQNSSLAAGAWDNLVTTNGNRMILPITNTVEFFRVQGQ